MTLPPFCRWKLTQLVQKMTNKSPPPDFRMLPDKGVPSVRGGKIVDDHPNNKAYRECLHMMVDCGMRDTGEIIALLYEHVGRFYKWQMTEEEESKEVWKWVELDEKNVVQKIRKFIQDLGPKKEELSTIPRFMREMAAAEFGSGENSDSIFGFEENKETNKPGTIYGFDEDTTSTSYGDLSRFVEALNHEDFRAACEKESEIRTSGAKRSSQGLEIKQAEEENWAVKGVKSMNNGYMVNPDAKCTIWTRHAEIYQKIVKDKKKHQSDEDKKPCTPEDVVKYAEARVCTKRGFKLKDKYFLLIKGKGQPTHIDALTESRKEGAEVVAGCMYLSKRAKCTQLYDMNGVKKSKEMTWDYVKESKEWKDAPESVFEQLENEPIAKKNLRNYGQLLFATPERRREPIMVDQFSILTFDSDTPHNAPEGERVCLFFLAEKSQIMDEEGIAARTRKKETQTMETKLQFSRDKLLLSLWEHCKNGPLDAEEYMRKKFFDSFLESRIRGVEDATISWPKGTFQTSAAIQEKCLKKLYPVVKHKVHAHMHLNLASKDASSGYAQLKLLCENRNTCQDHYHLGDAIRENKKKMSEEEDMAVEEL